MMYGTEPRRPGFFDNAYLASRTLRGVANSAHALRVEVTQPHVSAAEAAGVLLEARAVLERLLDMRRRLLALAPPSLAADAAARRTGGAGRMKNPRAPFDPGA
jgi:hypothetical protein